MYIGLSYSNTQTRIFKGRFIGEITRFIYDLMAYKDNNKTGLLMLIDYKKAFDLIKQFNIQRGCRQGDPIAPLLSIIGT